LYATVPAKKPNGHGQTSSASTPSVYSSMPTYATSENPNGGFDCTICYENPIDSVLYMCGHMCMCYGCAIKHWRGGAGGGVCPLCRASIKDVIRTYKS
jgi:protein neuralized